MSKRHTGFFLVSYVWLLTAVSVGASPIFLVEEGFGNDILLKFEFGVLSTVGNIGFRDVRGLGYDATTDTLFGVNQKCRSFVDHRSQYRRGNACELEFLHPSGRIEHGRDQR